MHETSCSELDHRAVQTLDAAPTAGVVVGVNEQPVVVALRTSPGDR
jgi:hypothetical protein